MDQLEMLKKDIATDKDTLGRASAALQALNRNFGVFLNDQGRVLAIIEKATARRENQGQDVVRSQMYKTIVKAIYTSPALESLPEHEREGERNELLQILRQLELVEDKTDELVRRVLLKLKAINREESSQTSQIEEQLTSQEAINNDLDDLNDRIDKNNASIVASTETLKGDVMKNLETIRNKGKVQCVIIVLCAIIILCALLLCYFVYVQIKKNV